MFWMRLKNLANSNRGGTIIEATSGNKGIAFSYLAKERGYKMIVVMPSNMTEARKQMIRGFEAEIVEVAPGDFVGAARKRDQLVAKAGAFCPRQFCNPLNVEAHQKHTAQEILEQVHELDLPHIEAFVAGTGTGGTLMGVGFSLKSMYPNLKVVAVEPTESAVMQNREPGLHKIQGIGDGFIPPIVQMEYVDEVVDVTGEEAIQRAQQLNQDLDISVGISSGANVLSAEKYIEQFHPKGIVITVLPDHANRYGELSA